MISLNHLGVKHQKLTESLSLQVDVYTSDIRFAGTDANVKLTIFGAGPPGTTEGAEVSSAEVLAVSNITL